MKITMLGAAGGEVTGSAYLVQTASANVLVDCGMFQGGRKLENWNRLPQRGPLQRLHAVLLTHAHLDHTGRLPLLTRFGYSGPVFATAPTLELTELILRDSARLQKEDARRENRHRRGSRKLIEPLYKPSDIRSLPGLFRRIDYEKPTVVASGVSVRAVDAGHILGSASLEVTVEEGGRKKVAVFSGDLGPRGAPLHRDPVPFKGGVDLVFMESTYGDREHPSLAETAVAVREAVQATAERGGRILVPVFAIGRTQLLLLMLAGAFKRKTLKPFPIFLDSPMAINATRIYRSHADLFDQEALAMYQSGELSMSLRTLKICEKPRESKALVEQKGPFLILSGGGMCTGGRILQHLQNYLPDPTTLVVMVGYQSRGSTGRSLLDGASTVRIMGRTVPVQAKTMVFGGLSGHAGQADLLHWIGSMAASRPRVFLTHGEDGPRTALGSRIKDRFGLETKMPGYREVIEA